MACQEDKNCSRVRRPYYFVADAAKKWCNIQREIVVDCNGLPEDDPSNPCLRIRAEEIMYAIDEGVLRCGRDGKKIFDGDHVAPYRRTVLHDDLKTWMVHNFPGDKPDFLFDDMEKQTRTSINISTYNALKAAHDAKEIQLGTMQASILTLTKDRDGLKKQLKDYQSLGKRRRESWLVVMACLCEMAKVEPAQRGLATQIAERSERIGARVSDDTIREILSLIPGALEAKSS